MKTRSISDDDQCGGCKYRIMADTPDDGDRCVHDFAGIYDEDEDGTIKTCHDFERPTRVLIISRGPASSATAAALTVAGFDVVVDAEASKVNGLPADAAFFDESTIVKHLPRLGMTTPKFYGRDEDGILAQHQRRWLMQIRDLESAQPQCTGLDELVKQWDARARASLVLHRLHDDVAERTTALLPEHGMPYGNPLGPQPMKPKPNKAKARAKKRARIAAQSRRRNRK